MADLPAPDHSLKLAYYFDWSFYGNYRAEIASRVNTYLVWDYVMGGDLTALVANMTSAIGSGGFVIFGPNLSPAENVMSVAALAGLDAVAAQWADVDAVYFDEPGFDQAGVETLIANWNAALDDRSLAHKPIWINFSVSQINSGTGYLAAGIDVLGLEAYVDPTQQNSPTLVADLTAQIEAQKAIVGTRDLFLVVQAYNRNGTWINITSLRDIQTVPYQEAYSDANVLALLLFSWARPGGTRDLPQCIQQEHKRIWGAIASTTQPDTIVCTNAPPVTPAIPAGTIVFSGFGNAPMKFYSPEGVDLGVPPSNPWLGTAAGAGGCNGLLPLDGHLCATGTGYPGPDNQSTIALNRALAVILGFDTRRVHSIAGNYKDRFYGLLQTDS